MSVLDELLVALGYDYDETDLKKFKADVGRTADAVKAMVTVAAAGATALTALVVTSTRASDEQGKLSREVGDTVGVIDALEFALRRAGGSSGGMTSSLRNLGIRASEASRGVGSGVEAFGLLGMSVTDANGGLKSTSNLMLELSQRLGGLNQAKQLELADKLGVGGSIRLLQKGPVAIRELMAEATALGVTTEEDSAIAAEFQDGLTDLWQVFKQITRTLTRELAPIMKRLIGTFVEWWKANKKILEQDLPGWLSKTASALKLLSIAGAIWLAVALTRHITSLVTLFKNLTLSVLAANAAMFLTPMLIGLAVAAFALLIDDAKTFFEGGDSLMGDMIDKFPGLRDGVTGLGAGLAVVGDLVAMVADGWRIVADLIMTSSFSNLNITAFFKTIGHLIGQVVDGWTLFIDSVLDTSFHSPITDGLARAFGEIGEMITQVIDGWNKIIGLFSTSTSADVDKLLGNTVPFLADVTGVYTVGGGGLIPETQQRVTTAVTTMVDKVEIEVVAGVASAVDVANSVFERFEQTSQDLVTGLEM